MSRIGYHYAGRADWEKHCCWLQYLRCSFALLFLDQGYRVARKQKPKGLAQAIVLAFLLLYLWLYLLQATSGSVREKAGQ